MMRTTSISTMHATSTSSLLKSLVSIPIIIIIIILGIVKAYLETRPSSQRTPQFHHGPANFISHGDFAAVMLDWCTSGGVVVVCALVLAAAQYAGSWGATGCCCGCVGCCGCLWGTSEAGEETWFAGGCCAGHF